jgi:hypothetical protein
MGVFDGAFWVDNKIINGATSLHMVNEIKNKNLTDFPIFPFTQKIMVIVVPNDLILHAISVFKKSFRPQSVFDDRVYGTHW